MKIIMKRTVPVVAFKAVMEIGEIKKDYDFYLSVLELEEQFNEITPALVNEHLLQRNPNDVIGYRIIKMMVLYRLITTIPGIDNLQVTQKGEKFIQNLRLQSYDQIDETLKDILVAAKILLKNNWGQYSANGNNPFSLIHDIEMNKSIRPEFRDVTNYLENQQYISIPTLRFQTTDIGKEALEREKVPIAQSSSYTLYTTDDPIFDENHIIAYEPIHLKEKSWHYDGKEATVKPNWLSDLITSLKDSPKILRLAAQNLDEIYLYGIQGEIFSSSKKITVNICLTISKENKPELLVIPEKFKPVLFEHKVNLTIDEVLKIIQKFIPFEISQLDDQYSFLIPYKEVKSNGWIGKRKINYSLNNIVCPPLGQFDEVIIENIQLLPKTEKDAVDWAKDLILEKLTYYFSEEDYDKVSQDVSEKFSQRFPVHAYLPPFAEFVREITSKKNTNPKIFWFVNAPKYLTFRSDIP